MDLDGDRKPDLVVNTGASEENRRWLLSCFSKQAKPEPTKAKKPAKKPEEPKGDRANELKL